MSIRAIGVIDALWILSLLAATSLLHAQWQRPNPVTPRVVAGADFGFRIEGEQNGAPVGMPVVRLSGEWMAVQLDSASGQTRPVH